MSNSANIEDLDRDVHLKKPSTGNSDSTRDSGLGSSSVSDKKTLTSENELLRACESGNLTKVSDLIVNQHVEVNKCEDDTEHGDNPLHLAAFHGHLYIVKYLVDNEHCEVESRNKYLNTPLHRAARNGKLEVVQYLIEEKKSDPMCVCTWKRTPLHNACKGGSLDAVKYLMNIEGVDINYQDNEKAATPLDIAAEYGTLEVVKYIITEKKSSLKAGTNTVLHRAAYGGKREIVQYLIEDEGYDPMLRGRRGRTPLHFACKKGQLDVVKYLMDNPKVNPTCRDNKYGMTPLDLAAEFGTLDVVMFMVEEKKCEVKYKNGNRNSALHQAAYGGNLERVKFFIEGNYCHESCGGWQGKTPLHSACRSGKYDVVDYLIEQCKVDASCQDDVGNTPLHEAVRSGDKTVVMLLVAKFDCKTSVKNKEGKTPSDIAEERRRSDISTYLASVEETHSSKTRKQLIYHLKKMKIIVEGVAPTGKKLGQGSYGSVIELKVDSEVVAGKVYKFSSHTQFNIEKVKNEITVLNKLRNKNIVLSKGVCFLPDKILPVLLMERLIISLHDYLLHPGNPNLPMEGKIAILRDAANGLDYLHNHTPAIIHRDLTAKNVLLDSELRAKIADFGNSRIMELDPDSSPETMTSLPGTLEYMPPEAQGGSVTYDPSLDVFSFGHLSLFTITQTPVRPLLPPSYTDSTDELCARSEVKRRERFLKKAEQLLSENQSLVSMIKRCLHNSPAQRPHTGELHKILQDASGLLSHPEKRNTASDTACIKKFLQACEDGNMGVIKEILEKNHMNVHSFQDRSDNDCTPLHKVSQHGHLAIMKLLVEVKNCDVECGDRLHNTPLHYACKGGKLEIVQYLIQEKKCVIMPQDLYGKTPLHYAARHGKFRVVRYIISIPNVKSSIQDRKNGSTPLHVAAEFGTEEMVRFMIDQHNNDSSCKNLKHNTPLHQAAYGGKLSVVKYLINEKQCNPEAEGYRKRTPLHDACKMGRLEVVNYLLKECKVNPACQDGKNATPLHMAALYGHLRVVKLLVEEFRCSPCVKSRNGETPLDCAQREGHCHDDVADYLSSLTYPVIRDAEIVAQTKVKILPGQPLSYYWEEHGFEVHIPAGATPADGAPVTMSIQASLKGKYQFPDDRVLVSGVYWLALNPLVRFAKKVTVGIQHCGSAEDEDSGLSFITAKCTQQSLPYTFEALPGGSFTDTRLGKIQVNHFSGIGITSNGQNTSYAFCTYYIRKQLNAYEARITVTQNLELILKEVKQVLEQEGYQKGLSITANIEESDISLDIQPQCNPEYGWENCGWELSLLVSSTLSKNVVDDYKTGQEIPYFAIDIKLTDIAEPQSLRQKIKFTGIKQKDTFITLFRRPEQQGEDQTRQYSATSEQNSKDKAPTMVTLRRFKTKKRVIKVIEESADRYKDIGTVLLNDEHGHRIRAIESSISNSTDGITEVYQKWITEDVDHSWMKLIQCFKDYRLNVLADEIEQHFGLLSPQAPSERTGEGGQTQY